MPEPLKIAVVTPYYKPEEAMLRQCQDSVRAQTLPCTHIPVADGYPHRLFDDAPDTLHVILPRSNQDFGNTPRGIGCTLANSYGFDAVAFLDDDNWYEPDHLESMVALHRSTGMPLICCRRRFRHLDGAELPTTEAAEDRMAHVDANCWLIFRPAFALLSAWYVPKNASYIADRIFFQKAVRERYRIASTGKRTVNYRSKHPSHYRTAGVPEPDGVYSDAYLQRQFAAVSDIKVMADIVNAIGFFPRL
jgi:glycosyltransferase involved in cell wall biosynthesis